MRVVQINLGNSQLAGAELAALRDVDIAAVQEPYSYKNDRGRRVLPVLQSGGSRIAMSKFDEETGRINSAVVVLNKDLACMSLTHLCDEYFSVMLINGRKTKRMAGLPARDGETGAQGPAMDNRELSPNLGNSSSSLGGSVNSGSVAPAWTNSIVIISGYFKFNKDTRLMVDRLNLILANIGPHKVVFCGDVNARSGLWEQDLALRGCPKGIIVEEFIAHSELKVANQPGWPKTYCNNRGQSDIDVTLVNSLALLCRVKNWGVYVGLVTSDHRLIRFEIDGWDAGYLEEPMFKVRNDTDWAHFKVVLQRELDTVPIPQSDDRRQHIDSRVAALTLAYQNTCLEVLGYCNPVKHRGTVWWSRRLEQMKREVSTARRKYQNHQDPVWRVILRRRLYTRKHKYRSACEFARRQSWNRLVKESMTENCWGFIYKLAYNKLKGKTLLHSVRAQQGDFTLSVHDALNEYLNTLLPGDVEPARAEEMVRVAHGARTQDENLVIEPGDVEVAIRDIAKRRAPGKDNIPGIAILQTRGEVTGILTELVNACLDLGYFPSQWKVGLLRHIIKGFDRDPALVKSYRPLTLLSEFSKVFERILKKLIRSYLDGDTPHSPKQFGYTEGTGTIQAMYRLKNLIVGSRAKHRMGIFLDMAGAFDSVQWVKLLRVLEGRGLPRKLLLTLASYFTERKVWMSAEGASVCKTPSQGCPQGSILGPEFWNFIMDVLLNQTFPDGCEIQAYADDVALFVTGNSRTEIERRASEAMEIVQTWLTEHQIELSIGKCCYVLFLETLRRDPTVRFSGGVIRRAPATKYLGLWWDEKLTFSMHIKKVTEDAQRNYFALRKHIELNWNDPLPGMDMVYKGAAIPKALYGVGIWGDALCRGRDRWRLLRLQRVCCVGITGSKFSVSHESSQILANQPPLDLVASECVVLDRLRNGFEPVKHLGVEFTVADLDRLRWTGLKRHLREMTATEWQRRWTETNKGVHMKKYFPSVESRGKVSFKLTRQLTEVLTGHGYFAEYQQRILNNGDGLCTECGLLDHPEHRILSCQIFLEQQAKLMRACALDGLLWPASLEQIAHSKRAFKFLELFARRERRDDQAAAVHPPPRD